MKRTAFFVFAVASLLVPVAAAFGSDIVVANTNDDGPGSLRQAVSVASSDSQDTTITFDPVVFSTSQKIILTSGNIVIGTEAIGNRSLKIIGPGADRLTIDGNYHSRIFRVLQSFSHLEIDGVTLSHGNGSNNNEQLNTAFGGAIFISGGTTLTLRNSIISENESRIYGGVPGAINTGGDTLVVNCAIRNNYGGIASSSKLRVRNSTISSNPPMGIYGSNVDVVSTTVAYNKKSGISATQLRLVNSIVTENSTPEQGPTDVGGYFKEATVINTIVGKNFGLGTSDPADPHLDPELRTFGTNPIPVHALGVNSAAIDHGSDCVLKTFDDGGCVEEAITTDARGASRQQDGDGDGVAHVDIGAFESAPFESSSYSSAVVSLRHEDDAGPSNADNVTNTSDLTFDVNGVTPGATVQFLRNGAIIDAQQATGNQLAFTDNTLVLSSVYTYSVREIIGTSILTSHGLNVTYDKDPARLFIDRGPGQSLATSAQPIKFELRFTESVSGVKAEAVSLAGSTADVSAAVLSFAEVDTGLYNVTVSNIKSDGTVVLTVPGEITDIAGNLVTEKNIVHNSIVYDTTPPSVTVEQAPTQPDPTNVAEVSFKITFSEPVQNFTWDKVSFVDSTAYLTTLDRKLVGSGRDYVLTVSGFSTPGGTIVASIPAGAVSDAAGNKCSASTSVDNSVFVDNVAPTVTIDHAWSQPSLTNQLPIRFGVLFSEPVSGFDASDIELSATINGVDQNVSSFSKSVSGSGNNYLVAVGNLPPADGLKLSARVVAGGARDAVGNGNQASSSSSVITYDNVRPTATISPVSGQQDPATRLPITFELAFSEPVYDFDRSDITVVDTSTNADRVEVRPSGSGTILISVSALRAPGNKVAVVLKADSVRDQAGNGVLAANSPWITYMPISVAFDYDGDSKSDVSFYRPSTGEWWIDWMQYGFGTSNFGSPEDRIVPADYDGDSKTDKAFFRPSTGTWYVWNSLAVSPQPQPWGTSTDIPTPGDFDGDHKADLTVFRPSTGTWWIKQTGGGGARVVQYGFNGDVPVVGDYDGDGKADIAVFRPSAGVWYIQRSSAGEYVLAFGQNGDKVVPADYDGDGKTDIAVFRPSNGVWYIANIAANTFSAVQFGTSTDIPVPGDYDGDGKTDQAIFRPTDGTWWLNRSSGGVMIVQWGKNGDKPTPAAFVN